jgi:hypothetical protein
LGIGLKKFGELWQIGRAPDDRFVDSAAAGDDINTVEEPGISRLIDRRSRCVEHFIR